MLIEKYIFYFEKANGFSSKKIGLTRALSSHELFCLYSVRRLVNTSKASLKNFSIKSNYLLNDMAIYRSYKFLIEQGMIDGNTNNYCITIKGREYISLIRRWLLKQRISNSI